MNKLEVLNGSLYLDGCKLLDVEEYELKSSASTLGTAELTLKMRVATSDSSIESEGILQPWHTAKIDLLE